MEESTKKRLLDKYENAKGMIIKAIEEFETTFPQK
jgi:hypothetical protein